jgi:hypothetical protein
MSYARNVLNRQIRLVRKSLAVAAALSAFGCTTARNVSLVENSDPSSRPREIEVVSRGGRYAVFRPTVAGDSLRGWSDYGRTRAVAFALSDIQRARVTQFSGGRTALAIGGVTVAALGLWILAIMSSGGISPSY